MAFEIPRKTFPISSFKLLALAISGTPEYLM
ncbi:hypothetical protein BY454_12046 [Marinobacter persicus]|uniref:Uncharacterized protein n=1 Tax=Marinobacter persicus TaxID=930118 RepID=A0A2S6G507_9GAMM|nr:hypothetical protein BY455_11946 [Marinobacter persicus]PPK54189.1 hypothetical protein B0H24_101846 [Marinobacter persicus]PPK57465.1 hypothetical protein BY454_12046 [Marinobacter persicus]